MEEAKTTNQNAASCPYFRFYQGCLLSKYPCRNLLQPHKISWYFEGTRLGIQLFPPGSRIYPGCCVVLAVFDMVERVGYELVASIQVLVRWRARLGKQTARFSLVKLHSKAGSLLWAQLCGRGRGCHLPMLICQDRKPRLSSTTLQSQTCLSGGKYCRKGGGDVTKQLPTAFCFGGLLRAGQHRTRWMHLA